MENMELQQAWFEEVPELCHYVQRPAFLTTNTFYWAITVIFAVLQMMLAPLYILLSAIWNIDMNGYITAAQVLMYLGTMLLPVGAYMLARPREREAFRLKGASLRRMLTILFIAGAGFLAANFLTTLWMVLLEGVGLVMEQSPDILTGNLPLDLMMISVLPALCEELLFRGLVLGTYERWGTWKAILISAAMFAGLHGSIAGLPAHLMLGVVLGFVAASTNSLVPCMALHAVYNAITVVISHFAPAEETAEAALPLIEQLGGIPGIGAVMVSGLVSLALMLFCLRHLEKLRLRADEPFGSDAVIERKRLIRTDIVLLASAGATVLWFYIQDIISML